MSTSWQIVIRVLLSLLCGACGAGVRMMPLNVTGSYTRDSLDEVMRVLRERGCAPQIIHFRRLQDGGPD